MNARLVSKTNTLADACLVLLGEYADPVFKDALNEIGWDDGGLAPASPLPAEFRSEGDETEWYSPPSGSRVFGLHTPEEGRTNLRALRAVLTRFSVKIVPTLSDKE